MAVAAVTSCIAAKKEDQPTDTALLIGEQPDNELQSTTRWIVFQSATNFNQPLAADFTLTNLDPYPVAYCLKARDRTMFVITEPYGLLQGHEEVRVRLFLKRADAWSRDVSQLLGRHQIAVENLRLPAGTRAANLKTGRQLARELFKRSGDKCYMQRLFWRINVVLLKKDEATSTAKVELIK